MQLHLKMHLRKNAKTIMILILVIIKFIQTDLVIQKTGSVPFVIDLINREESVKTEVKEIARNNKNCELRLGIASWDDGSGESKSIKYTWFDKNGKAARGGEFPIEALPQALEFAIRNGYITL